MIENSTLIVIPTFNEKENIIILIKKILVHAPGADILVVDDDSPDSTGAVVRNFSRTSPSNIEIIVRKGIRGLGSAYTAGFKYGIKNNYDVIITMDADLSHNPCYLPVFLNALEHHDVVVGSRYMEEGGTKNWGIHRIFLSWLANRFARYYWE